MPALKFVDGSDTAIEGNLMPFGGPAFLGGKDLSREYFSAKTDFCLDWYPDGVRPLLYHHGLDGAVKTTPVGRITGIAVKEDGGWMQAQLDKHGRYYTEITQLIKQQKVGLSSGAMPHLVEVDGKSGEIKRWPVVEGSITPTPCNPLALVDFAAVTKHYKSAGVDMPAQLKAALDAEAENALNDSDFAYVDADGGRHLPIHDAAHVRAAMARFNQEKSFASAADPKAARRGAARKIMAAAKKFNIDLSPDTDVAMAAKAIMESDDSAGGFATDGDGDSGAADDTDDQAMGAHTDTRSHFHTHADGLGHTHAHRHVPNQPSHDMAPHSHPVGTMANGLPRKAAGDSGDAEVERSFEDIRDDITDLLNPSGPVPTGCWTAVLATYPDYVIVCRHEYDSGDDDTYWKIAYTLDANLEPTLGDATPVEQVWQPKAAKSAATPLTLNAHAASRQAAALAQEAKALGERRATDARPLSAPNYRAIAAAKAGLLAAAEGCAAVLADSDAREQQQAKAAALVSPESLEIRLALLNLAAGLLPSGGHAA